MASTELHVVNLDSSFVSNSGLHLSKNMQKPGLWMTLALFVIGFVFLGMSVSWSQATMYVVAGVLGLTLYHARYGFTTAYRNFIVGGRGVGFRAQMVMFLFANILFLPVLVHGHMFGHSVIGVLVRPACALSNRVK